jgi:hypothetical protein
MRKYAEVSAEEGVGVLCLENFGFVYANPKKCPLNILE